MVPENSEAGAVVSGLMAGARAQVGEQRQNERVERRLGEVEVSTQPMVSLQAGRLTPAKRVDIKGH